MENTSSIRVHCPASYVRLPECKYICCIRKRLNHQPRCNPNWECSQSIRDNSQWKQKNYTTKYPWPLPMKTEKLHPWKLTWNLIVKGKSSSKPPFLCSMLIFQGLHILTAGASGLLRASGSPVCRRINMTEILWDSWVLWWVRDECSERLNSKRIELFRCPYSDVPGSSQLVGKWVISPIYLQMGYIGVLTHWS